MQKQAIPKEPVASYKEVRIGKTLYRVTSVFSGEKDLGRTLEQLAVRRAMTELDSPAAAQPCHGIVTDNQPPCGGILARKWYPRYHILAGKTCESHHAARMYESQRIGR